MNLDSTRKRIIAALKKVANAKAADAADLIPTEIKKGKLYEAHALAHVLERLRSVEGLQVMLSQGTKVHLKRGAGPVNRSYPHFELRKAGTKVAEVWTDVEFTALSWSRTGATHPPTAGEKHELDIVIVPPGTAGYPTYEMIWLGAECKHTTYGKDLLRQILGIRRELSFLDEPQPTQFAKWPAHLLPARPASCLLVYATDAGVRDFAVPGKTFGIEFIHWPMP